MRFFWVAIILFSIASARAEVAPAPYASYAAGKYDDAIRAGVAQNNSAGYAIAARAVLADATSRDTPCLKCLQRAEALARRAIALDPKLPDGHTYVAVSLGYEARIVGPVVARLRNFPNEAKRELDAALADDPKNVWALAARGGWNIEIVRTGGETLAKWFYDATIARGLENFTNALALDPNNIVVSYQFSLSLAGYDVDRFHSEITDALARSIRTRPVTVYERLVHARAQELSDLLRRGDRSAFLARVRKYQGYP